MKPVMRILMFLIYALCLLPGCSGGNDVVSDDTTGILSIESVNVPAQSGGSGTVSVKLVAPKGGPGSGTLSISSTDSSLISFSPTSQSASSSGTASFYFTTTAVQTDTVVTYTVTAGTLSISKQITLKATSSSSGVTVTSPAVNSISFVSATPASISLKGAGGTGNTETSVISFIVKDVTGQPLAGQTIDFTLDTSVGGLSIIPTSAVSDSSGTVKTIVNAGVISTPVRVAATVRSTAISVKSDQLTVSTGLPHQDGLSISSSPRNPEALDYDGAESTITAMLSDHFGNPVPDGTSVYFTTYGGSIEPAGTTSNGKTTVKWRSQNPKPADGIITILAYAIGEESFTDLNGNGLADIGEFKDLPEAFLAKSRTFDSSRTYCNPASSNFNPQLDSTNCFVRDPQLDPFIDFNGDGVYNTGDGSFNGILQGTAFRGAPRSIYIFKNYQIIMSGSKAIVSPTSLTIAQNTSTKRTLTITDTNGNSLPEKTTIGFSSTIGGCPSTSGLTISPASKTVDNTGTQINFDVTLSNECTVAGSGILTVTVKTPNGIETNQDIAVAY